MNAQENYEQLKRRNRRRLVGALIMVVIAAILLLVMLSRRTPQPVPAPQLDIKAASAARPASAAMDTQSASAVVLEPAASAPALPVTVPASEVASIPVSSAASVPPAENHVSKTAATVVPVVPQVKPVRPAPQKVEAEKATVKPVVQPAKTLTEHKSQPVEQKRLHHEEAVASPRIKPAATRPVEAAEKNPPVRVTTVTKPRTPTETVEKPASKAPAAAENRKQQAVGNTTVSSTKTVVESEKKTSTVAKTPVKNPAPVKPAATPKQNSNAASGKNSNTTGRLTPQQILENKAAAAVSRKSTTEQSRNNKAPVAATNNSKDAVERTVIQIGAYTTEAQANLVQQRLAVAGVPVSITTSQTSKGTLYRVRSRVYNSRSQAMQNLDKVQAVGLDGLVIGL